MGETDGAANTMFAGSTVSPNFYVPRVSSALAFAVVDIVRDSTLANTSCLKGLKIVRVIDGRCRSCMRAWTIHRFWNSVLVPFRAHPFSII